MRTFYLSLFTGLFLLAFVMPLHAQTPLPLGSKADLVAKFKTGTSNAQGKKFTQQLPNNRALDLSIKFSKKEANADVFSGSVLGFKNAHFYLKSSPTELHGYILLKDQKQAYKYYALENGATYLKAVDINEVICIEYREGPQQSYGDAGAGGLATNAVPLLQSLPGATAVVLLDFNGQTVTSPHWNDGNTINAAAATLTDAEAIETWKMISEDFRPWEINITTDESVYNSAPANRRMRCIFTPTIDWYGSAGGVAYVGSFTWGDNTPCWVFNGGIKGAGEAGSHEIGHTVGLNHDGRTSPVEEYYGGNNDWAPIMGVGYYVNVVQWSKGEYPNASNTEDDLNIIATTNGFGYRTDDHGNTQGSATALISAASGTVPGASNKGIISTRSDLDVFSFTTAAGTITLNANPDPDYPNLDIHLTLKNTGGTTLVTSNPSTLSASINYTLAAGTYYLHVDGVQGALGAHSDYGSMGAYSISGYIVNDITPPVLSGVPANTSASCDNVPAPAVVTAVDNIDGSVPVSYSQSSTAGSCPGNYTLTRHWSATDAAGNIAHGWQTITVSDNTGPVISGVPASLSKLVDAGRCDAVVTFSALSASDNCGTASLTTIPASGAVFPLGITTVQVRAVDQCGNETNTSFDVEVTNDDPVIVDITAPLEPQPVNQLVSATAQFTDNNLASAQWAWGDGLTTAGAISGNTISGTHAYTGAGVYTITLAVADACGASDAMAYQYVVVYDPSAGFVTGGGWFDSPAGAYLSDPLATGMANFGFVSKYKKGAHVPDGNTSFEFRAADLTFHSTSYEWLVISGYKAQYKGFGSLNGVDGYGFILSAVDGIKKSSTEPDRIRIKIWDSSGSTIYDNQLGSDLDAEALMPISGGSVVIHTGKGKASASAGTTASSRLDETPSATTLAAYPNPLARSGLWLELQSSDQHQRVQAHIYDLQGRLMTNNAFILPSKESKHLWLLDHSQWRSGMYLLVIKTGDSRQQQLLLFKQ